MRGRYEEVVCRKCGAENPAGNLLCKNCGEELHEELYKSSVTVEGIRKRTSNPAISWMQLGCILVAVSLFLIVTASLFTPQPPTGEDVTTTEDLEKYAKDLQAFSDALWCYWIVFFVGMLIFMPATIYGMSRNIKK